MSILHLQFTIEHTINNHHHSFNRDLERISKTELIMCFINSSRFFVVNYVVRHNKIIGEKNNCRLLKKSSTVSFLRNILQRDSHHSYLWCLDMLKVIETSEKWMSWIERLTSGRFQHQRCSIYLSSLFFSRFLSAVKLYIFYRYKISRTLR